MSDIGTVELILIRAAVNGEFLYDPDLTHGYLWRGTEADYDCTGKLFYLIRDGYLTTGGADGDRRPVEVTDLGRSVLR